MAVGFSGPPAPAPPTSGFGNGLVAGDDAWPAAIQTGDLVVVAARRSGPAARSTQPCRCPAGPRLGGLVDAAGPSSPAAAPVRHRHGPGRLHRRRHRVHRRGRRSPRLHPAASGQMLSARRPPTHRPPAAPTSPGRTRTTRTSGVTSLGRGRPSRPPKSNDWLVRRPGPWWTANHRRSPVPSPTPADAGTQAGSPPAPPTSTSSASPTSNNGRQPQGAGQGRRVLVVDRRETPPRPGSSSRVKPSSGRALSGNRQPCPDPAPLTATGGVSPGTRHPDRGSGTLTWSRVPDLQGPPSCPAAGTPGPAPATAILGPRPAALTGQPAPWPPPGTAHPLFPACPPAPVRRRDADHPPGSR